MCGAHRPWSGRGGRRPPQRGGGYCCARRCGAARRCGDAAQMAEARVPVRSSPRQPSTAAADGDGRPSALRVGDVVTVDRKWAVGEGGLATIVSVPEGPSDGYVVKYAAGRSEKGLARGALRLRDSTDSAGEEGYTDGVATRSRSAEEEEGAVFEIEDIINKRVVFKGGKGTLQYKVRWRGFGPQADTWEPLENLSTALSLVSDYEAILWKKDRGIEEDRKPPSRSPSDPQYRGADGRPHITSRTLWTTEEDAELAQLVHEHGVIGAWDSIAEAFSVDRTGNALSKRWSKIKEQWEDADSAAASAVASSRRKNQRDAAGDDDSLTSKKRRVSPTEEEEEEEEDDGLTDEEWLALVDVGSDVEVRDRQSWYACKIVQSEEQRVKIHFVGCGRRYDRWVTRSSDFLRRLSPVQVTSSEEEESEEEDEDNAASDDDRADVDRTIWTAEEDAELSRLVHKYGAGNWSVMGGFFSSGRSSNALRNRWMRLERQGGSDGGGRKAALARMGDRREEEQGGWTLTEDLELAEAVRKTGPRDWAGKQSMLSHGRSANAIRKRWTKLEEDAEGAAVSGDERVRVWNKKTHRMLAGASAPRRDNLQRYLREHPDMEVYADQDQESDSDEDEFVEPASPAWLKGIDIGTKLEARDETGWYEAKVLETEKDEVKIHYIGFGGKYDVWTPRDLEWLRPLTLPRGGGGDSGGGGGSSKASSSSAAAAKVATIGTAAELSGGRTALLQQVIKLKQMYADTAG